MNALVPAILLVEDDSGDRELFEYAARSVAPPPRLCFARDGDEAISYLSGSGDFAHRERFPFPDIVVLDLNLPRVPGFEVLRWTRAQPALSGLPVTVLSSSAETRDIETAYALGANAYLVKTPDLSEMAAVVRGLCEQARLRAGRPGPGPA